MQKNEGKKIKRMQCGKVNNILENIMISHESLCLEIKAIHNILENLHIIEEKTHKNNRKIISVFRFSMENRENNIRKHIQQQSKKFEIMTNMFDSQGLIRHDGSGLITDNEDLIIWIGEHMKEKLLQNHRENRLQQHLENKSIKN